MTTERTLGRWILASIIALALAGFASLCQAQSVITLSNDSSLSPAFYDGGTPQNPGGTATNWWQGTNGPNGGGCIGYYMDGLIDFEIDPAFNVSFSTAQYYLVTVQMMVSPSSGTLGTGGSGGYGHSQLSFRDTSYSWNGVGYTTIFPPAANAWVTYNYAVPSVANLAHLQLQLQGVTNGYSAPVTVYIGNVTIYPVPNPLLLTAFTNDIITPNWQNYGLNASWDGTQDAPYFNPVTGAGPTSITPPGSAEFQAATPSGYPGGQLNMGFNPSDFQSTAFDLYYDGPTPLTNDYGGFQIFIANANSPYNWAWIGSANFNAGMIGTWTHYNFPCSSSGIVNAAGFAIQATPGAGPGTNAAITFHIDNIQVWTPQIHPTLSTLMPPTPGGVQLTLDGDSTNNLNDQEGFSSPSTNNAAADYFWINQTPATYSFTLTNFPNPLAAPSFDAHIYLWNGVTEAARTGGSYGYNSTYSGAPYNVPDYFGFHVQNGTNGGVVALVDWKTNLPSANAFTNISFQYPSMANANGTWSLNFTDNTHGSIVAPDNSVNSFVLPDFASDPNYTANFSPAVTGSTSAGTSVVQFGVFKNNNITNNGQTVTMTRVLVTNSVTGTNTLSDGFGGPGLTGNYNWQVCTYYIDGATRAIWQPFGTAYWISWNTTAAGWAMQSSSNLLGGWTNAGLSYTHPDGTGTNTLGAVPATNLPSPGTGFFRLIKQ